MNYECLACGARFNEMDQTNHEYKNGICPCCGHNDIKPDKRIKETSDDV